jgi:predicted amidophosphoribosyltransferase
MKHCPICRASLNGASTCRRCRADLRKVQEVEIQGQLLAGAALHSLALGDTGEALRLLRRAYATQAAPELLALLRKLRAEVEP